MKRAPAAGPLHGKTALPFIEKRRLIKTGIGSRRHTCMRIRRYRFDPIFYVTISFLKNEFYMMGYLGDFMGQKADCITFTL